MRVRTGDVVEPAARIEANAPAPVPRVLDDGVAPDLGERDALADEADSEAGMELVRVDLDGQPAEEERRQQDERGGGGGDRTEAARGQRAGDDDEDRAHGSHD